MAKVVTTVDPTKPAELKKALDDLIAAANKQDDDSVAVKIRQDDHEARLAKVELPPLRFR
jgi:hypothetical protein